MFAQNGPVVEDYMARLATYAVAIMGKGTYELGYRLGLKSGQNPYEHMTTLVFSRSMALPNGAEVTVHAAREAQFFRDLKASSTGPIYLCGGGAFAGSLLSMGLIDLVRLKRAPVALGGGIGLFGNVVISPELRHNETRVYDDGYVFQEFEIQV